MDFFELLKQIMLPNKDNGKKFTSTERIDKIYEFLKNTEYRQINENGLFFAFAKKPISQIEKPLVISTHIDTVMNKFFTQEAENGMILGTYDNCVTNAAALYLMLNNRLNDNVIVAFTGDEEIDSHGAIDVSKFLIKNNKRPKLVIALDVTEDGWEKECDYTIENDFWSYNIGKKIIRGAEQISEKYQFVPSDTDEIPHYIDKSHIIMREADCDESWDYDEFNFDCFSLCIPTKGDMHSNKGVLARKESCLKYNEVLENILKIV